MDLLHSYDDDGESSQMSDNRQSVDPVGVPAGVERVPTGVAKPANDLESEWANFEKLLAGSETSAEDNKLSVTAIPDEKVSQSRTYSRSRSKSRSRSNSSHSSSSSRSSSADSVKEKKEKKSDSSGSSDEDDKKASSDKLKDGGNELNKNKDSMSARSPEIAQRQRSPTPIEAPRSRSRSVERKKSSDRSHRKSRSRSHDRHGHSSRRRRRSRSSSRNREKGRHRGSRSKRHRRSRSRDRHRRSRRRKSRDRSRSKNRSRNRSRSRDRKHRRRGKHHRSRSRSRSRSRGSTHRSPHRETGRYRDQKFAGAGFRSSEAAKPTFKEKMRQQLLKASKMLTQQAQAGQLPADGEKPLESPKEKPSALPLNVTNAFQNATNSSNVTPQMALLQTMAVMHQKAQEMTGIAVPKYYNPAAVNPLKYAEQVQKRKLLWAKSKDKKEETQGVWEATSFNSDQDGKVAAKFRKLMGMKEGEEDHEGEGGAAHKSEDINRKQQELFQRLDREYEFARMTTHTHRGIGLGFQSQGLPDT